LTEFFTDQLDTLRELDYETCPGEEQCSTNGFIHIARMSNPDMEAFERCKSCQYLPTKPGQQPLHLTEAIRIAMELMEAKSVCNGFNFPDILDYLTAVEWACVASLQLSQRDSEMNGIRERRSEARNRRTATELDQLRRK